MGIAVVVTHPQVVHKTVDQRRPLCNDEKCGKGEDANLAARYAGASVVRSRRVVSHSGIKA